MEAKTTIQLKNGGVAVIDPQDVTAVYGRVWRKSHFGYAVSTIPGEQRHVWMHRLITQAPDGMDVDHIDGDRLNNRRSNLRICERCQNLWNTGRHSDSRSPFKGICHKGNGRWVARIMVRGKRMHLGTFGSAELARDAYLIAAKEMHGVFSKV